MKISENYVLKEVVGEYIIVPIGENCVDLSGMTTVNETGAYIWELLGKGCDKDEILKNLLNEYDVEEIEAARDVEDFISKLIDKGIVFND